MLRATCRLLASTKPQPIVQGAAGAGRTGVDYAEPSSATSAATQTKLAPHLDISSLARTAAESLPASHASHGLSKAPSAVSATAHRTVLKNGLTVITRDSTDNVDHFAVFLKAGPAYLSPLERGYARILAYALLHTNKVSSTFAIIKAFAANQSISDARIVGRQLLAVSGDGLVEDPSYLFETLTNMLFMPSFQKWEIKESLEWYTEHYRKLIIKERPAAHIQDLVFKAAFGNGGLAEPVIIPEYVLGGGIDMNVLVSLWQRTSSVHNIAVVGSSTWTHAAVVDRLQHNEDITRNEGGDSAAPKSATCEFNKNGGTVLEFSPRTHKHAYQHGNTAAFGGLGFDAAGEDDARAAAAARVLVQHPALRQLVGVHHNDCVGGYTGFKGQGLIHFVTSAGNAAALKEVHHTVQSALNDVADGRGMSGSLNSMKIAAAIATQPREAAVDLMALQWANGVEKAVSVMDVTADDVVAVAKRALKSKPAVVYHGDVANVSRESLVQ